MWLSSGSARLESSYSLLSLLQHWQNTNEVCYFNVQLCLTGYHICEHNLEGQCWRKSTVSTRLVTVLQCLATCTFIVVDERYLYWSCCFACNFSASLFILISINMRDSCLVTLVPLDRQHFQCGIDSQRVVGCKQCCEYYAILIVRIVQDFHFRNVYLFLSLQQIFTPCMHTFACTDIPVRIVAKLLSCVLLRLVMMR